MAKWHRWSEDEREIVRRDYQGTNQSAERIATNIGVTFCAVKGQLANMGLLQQKSPPWSEKELERLSELIHVHPAGQIAKILNRSPNAVKIKATRLKLGVRARDEWYTKREVSEICGVDHKKVQSWIDSGALIATYHNGHRPQKNGMNMWHIEAKDFRKFIINYSEELLGRNTDIQQIIWIVKGNED